MSDKLVFDLAQEVEGTPNVFVRKDWINILDNQNQNYNNNQSVIDTSQLSNSNKYMSYRESYFSIPFVLSLASQGLPIGDYPTNYGANGDNSCTFSPASYLTGADSAIGLKNWFGQIIHSFTLDYNGTTIIQQTPYVNMWNSFKLVTSLSMSDVRTQGCTIGFYLDDPTSFMFVPPVNILAVPVAYTDGVQPGATVPAISSQSASGIGVCNNTNAVESSIVGRQFNNFNSGRGNIGFTKRQQYINFDLDAYTGCGAAGAPYSALVQTASSSLNLLWKSYVYNKVNQLVPNAVNYVVGGVTWPIVAPGAARNGIWQCAIVATVYLKHVHSFFNMCPLLKGVFMKMTMNLNNTSTAFQTLGVGATNNAIVYLKPTSLATSSVSNPLGGVNPLMIASGDLSKGFLSLINGLPPAVVGYSEVNGGIALFGASTIPPTGSATALVNGNTYTQTYRMNISVGAVCLDAAIGGSAAPLSKSIYLYIPAYTFNPVFEQAYLSSPVKQIKYTDIYQYQVLGVTQGTNFNNLLTNGIANIKSVLILPFYSSTSVGATVQTNQGISISTNSGFNAGIPVWQSPFDPAGTGPTSPCCWISNFNIQVSGQNAIYNMEKYNFEQWNNQLYGQNAVNGGLTDGLTSGLIDRQAFDMNYCYYYVNVERMLPVEQSVPKSIQVLGQNMTSKTLDLYCFIEYGVDISIDALTGARV